MCWRLDGARRGGAVEEWTNGPDEGRGRHMLVGGEGQRETMVENCRCRDGLKSPTQVITFKKKREIKERSGTP